MTNIAILYCKKIKDHSCVGCAKCPINPDEIRSYICQKFGIKTVIGTNEY